MPANLISYPPRLVSSRPIAEWMHLVSRAIHPSILRAGWHGIKQPYPYYPLLQCLLTTLPEYLYLLALAGPLSNFIPEEVPTIDPGCDGMKQPYPRLYPSLLHLPLITVDPSHHPMNEPCRPTLYRWHLAFLLQSAFNSFNPRATAPFSERRGSDWLDLIHFITAYGRGVPTDPISRTLQGILLGFIWTNFTDNILR